MRHFKFTDMRRHKLNWIWIILLGLFVGSCEDYLNALPMTDFPKMMFIKIIAVC